jgi:hypothetical protein
MTAGEERPIPSDREPRHSLRRVYVVGGEASGKTTLALTIGGRLDVPIHHLDSVAWRGVTGPDRPVFDPRFQPTDELVPRDLTERLAIVAKMAAADGWIAEGKHIGWTSELLEAAQLVVWLDHVPLRIAASRVVQRALRSGSRTMRALPSRGRLRRIAGYFGRARELIAQLRQLRAYYRSNDVRVIDADPAAVTRVATEAFLHPHREKLRHIRSDADLRRLLDALPPVGSPGLALSPQAPWTPPVGPRRDPADSQRR